jgi:hypothetical protein
MTRPGPKDERYAAWRRERRRVALAHHPDRGGNPEVYLRELLAVDERYEATANPSQSRPEKPDSRRRRLSKVSGRGRRSLRRSLRRLRGKVPRRLPGAQRYFDI